MTFTTDKITTKDDILAYLLKNGQGNALELADTLDISPQAIRRHLKDLESEGLIIHESVSVGMGRPQYIYKLSKEGRDLLTQRLRERFPHSYDDFAVSFIDTLTKTLGHEQVSLVLRQHWAQKGLNYQQKIGKGNLKERVGKLVEIRQSEGYMAEYYPIENNQFILTEHHCAISQVASTFPSVCGHELEMFAIALNCHIERTHWLIDGEHRCGYLIKTIEN
ncbi:MAG TPA: iron-sulfur cluster biosynthesis transcriptional regulator SufR [Allocoleopsis sp.]